MTMFEKIDKSLSKYKKIVQDELKEPFVSGEISAMGAGEETDGPVEVTDAMLQEEENERA